MTLREALGGGTRFMDEQVAHSTAMNDLITTLVEVVRAGVAKRPGGVHLTWVGGEFAKVKNAPFEQYVNHVVISDGIDIPISKRKMAPFIEVFCKDIISLEKTANQNYLVSLNKTVELPKSESAPIRASTSRRHFKKGIWPAFIRPIPEGKHRYLDTDRFVFTDSEGLPEGPHWIKVDSQYVAGVPAGMSFNTVDIEDLIDAWSTANGVSVESLTTTGPIETAPTLYDLARIIRSLPPSLSSNWMIPADVLRHLK